MPHDKIIPAPFTKGVNFTNWLEYRSADQIDENMFTRQDFANQRRILTGLSLCKQGDHYGKNAGHDKRQSMERYYNVYSADDNR